MDIETMESTAFIVEKLKEKYQEGNVYDRKQNFDLTNFPEGYFEDLKFFLECNNRIAVQTLLTILEEFPVKKQVGKVELREFKNASIVLLTLVAKTLFEVYGNRDKQIIFLSTSITKLEELEDVFQIKRNVLDAISTTIRSQSAVQKPSGNNLLVKKAQTIIQKRYRENLKLRGIASELGVSESYLSRSIKKETGLSVTGHIQRHRIEEGKQLLTKTEAPVHKIAIALGYNYQNHFASVFKKQVGMSPLEYRKMHFR